MAASTIQKYVHVDPSEKVDRLARLSIRQEKERAKIPKANTASTAFTPKQKSFEPVP